MKVFLIISQILYLLCIIPWLAVWGLSFMSFDNGIALWNSAFVILISLYPIAVILCSIFAWRIVKHNSRTALIVGLVPMLWIVSLGLLIIL
ncbi:hypothetical protein J2X07_003038 [Fictibacillus barbaricus]|uniref:Uncharacterized protein n=1 Tax=Fictibacillus barbaricus TaxID=182136 RepID=A0ABU1U3K0_9BACL|nr:hypothetical protein [Fictibacillus barbaricus]